MLSKHLPPNTTVWVFGSRARDGFKPHSDLDLAVNMHGEEVPFKTMGSLQSDLEESDLPIKVDIVDMNSCSDQFLKVIETDRVAF